MFYCSQYGYDTEILHEGYCEDCFKERQRELDIHNIQFYAWQGMTDKERCQAIQQSIGI